jgi:hypothetical protein
VEFPHKLRYLLEIILLMVSLGQIKLNKGDDFGKDFSFHGGCFTVSCLQCQSFLFLVVKEDGGHVLSLPGRPCRIVAGPKDVQEFLIRDFAGVVVDLDRFSVIAQVIIRGILFRSSRITDASSNNTGDEPEPSIRTPESPHCKGRRLRCGRSHGVYGWYGAISGGALLC